MKIGMVLDRPFPPDHRVEKEALSLIAAGHQVHLFCFNHGGQAAKELHNGIQVHRFYLPRLLFKKLLPLINVLPFYNWFWLWHLKRAIKKLRIEALHIHDLPLSRVGLRLKHRFHLPLIIDMHENYADWIEETPHYNTPIGRLVKKWSNWRAYERYHLQQADFVIGVAPVLIKKMIRDYDLAPQKVIFVPNTPDRHFMDRVQMDEDIQQRMKGRFNLIYVGGIAYLRGLQNVIPHMKAIKQRIPEVQLVIIGDGSYLPELKKLVQRLELEDTVFFGGWETIPRVAAYISLAHIGLYPPLKYQGVDDKVPTKMFQYWALARPIIASDHQLPREMITRYQAGFTVDFENQGERFVELVEKLYKEPELREQMGKNGRRAIDEEWNWEKTVQPLLQMYETLDKGENIGGKK